MSNHEFILQLQEQFAKNGFANLAIKNGNVTVKSFTLLPKEGGVVMQGGANTISAEKAAEAFLATAKKNNCELCFA